MFTVITFAAPDDETDAVIDGMILIHRNIDRDTGIRQQFVRFLKGIAAQTVTQNNRVHMTTHFFGCFNKTVLKITFAIVQGQFQHPHQHLQTIRTVSMELF